MNTNGRNQRERQRKGQKMTISSTRPSYSIIKEDEIYKRHPELLELKEFKNDKEIISAIKNGVKKLWEVGILYYKPAYIEGPIKILKIVTKSGIKIVIYKIPSFTFTQEHYVSDMQNHPAKAVFTSKKRAETFFKAARRAFAKDKMWKTEAAAHLKWATERRIRYGF